MTFPPPSRPSSVAETAAPVKQKSEFWMMETSHQYNLQGGPFGRGQPLVTSNWKLHFSIRSLYCDGTLNFMSTNTSSVPRPDGPPCICKRKYLLHCVPGSPYFKLFLAWAIQGD